jgi:hypothetical protein
MVLGCEMDSAGSDMCREDGNDHSGSIKDENFLDQVSDCQLL